jgi:alpha-tubulin suppressor-like RCC1 family protein
VVVRVFVQRETGGTLADVVKISVGSTSCAVTKIGELWCWGPNPGGWRTSPGLLGVGDDEEHHGAVRVPLEDVVDVALGWGMQACALKRSGQVYCWGSVRHAGQGPGVVGDVDGGWAFATPQAVPGLTDIVEIRAGAGHTCARRRNGQVLCWGQNSIGELGDGTKVERLSPTPVVGLYE